MAGKVFGIAGMIIAIPTYTVFRVIAKQFLSQFKFIKALTEKMVVERPDEHKSNQFSDRHVE